MVSGGRGFRVTKYLSQLFFSATARHRTVWRRHSVYRFVDLTRCGEATFVARPRLVCIENNFQKGTIHRSHRPHHDRHTIHPLLSGDSELTFACSSPLLITEKNGRFLVVMDGDFFEGLTDPRARALSNDTDLRSTSESAFKSYLCRIYRARSLREKAMRNS